VHVNLCSVRVALQTDPLNSVSLLSKLCSLYKKKPSIFGPSEHTSHTGRPSTPCWNKVLFLVEKNKRPLCSDVRTLTTPKTPTWSGWEHSLARHYVPLLPAPTQSCSFLETSSGAHWSTRDRWTLALVHCKGVPNPHYCCSLPIAVHSQSDDLPVCLPHANPTFDMQRRHRHQSRFKRAQQRYSKKSTVSYFSTSSLINYR
jgi:hypothetical protein